MYSFIEKFSNEKYLRIYTREKRMTTIGKNESLRNTILMGALGDAMGYQVEFMNEQEIDSFFSNEVTFEKMTNQPLIVSDDTQMSLYTLEGIYNDKLDPVSSIYQHYLDWGWTQLYSINNNISILHPDVSKLARLSIMRQAHAPGRTCMNALMFGEMGTYSSRINNSKGNGGVMRLAPLAVYYALNSDLTEHQIAMLGVDVSCITHGHDLSIIASYHFVYLLACLARDKNIVLEKWVLSSLKETVNQFSDFSEILEYKLLIEKSIRLAHENSTNDRYAINQIGEGWVAEETLAIALYCALKYRNNPQDALLSSVNHKGDSDSTGILTGNILGLLLENTDSYLPILKRIDLYDVITSLVE